MDKEETNPENARSEQEIFAELSELCVSDGFIHAIAYFCWRDNLIRFTGDQVTEDDVQHQYSHDRLLRTEISTLIGLMAKRKITLKIPEPKTLQLYIDRTETLLYEMHMSLQKPWLAAFKALALDPSKSNGADPFSTADGLRESIFYSGESAYNFQYEAFARLKYQADNEWLKSNKGFTIDEACLIVRSLADIQMQRLMDSRDIMAKLSPDQWTFLPGFVFSAEELVALSGLNPEEVGCFLDTFCFDRDLANKSFSSLSAFNETNAAPIINCGNGSFILLQHYSLLEALHDSPFFWMATDKSYSATASENRGEFTERFLADRLTRVFGARNVFRNIDIYKGKNRFAEADVLVLYGDRAIVVQAKSKRLTLEARKGNDLQLKDDFKKAIQHAYDQALLCSIALLGEEYRFVDTAGGDLNFQKRPTKIFPVCAVSDHYPSLAAQARQFLEADSSESIQSPVVTDVFFIDVLTEILETPLHFLNYLALRTKYDDRLLVSQELTNLGYHLKHNLWLEDKYNMVNLGDDFTSSLDIAMSARRLGVPGEPTPKGILNRFDGSAIGRLLSEIEATATPELVGLGMMFMQLSSNSAKHINNGIDRLVFDASRDGKPHDMSVPCDAGNAGFTIHINSLSEADAHERLSAHCRIRKHDTKSDAWYGILLTPGTGVIKGALVIEEKWVADPKMDEAIKAWPKKPMVPISTLSSRMRRKKIGRNEQCPCGSGKKYKKCCLNQFDFRLK